MKIFILYIKFILNLCYFLGNSQHTIDLNVKFTLNGRQVTSGTNLATVWGDTVRIEMLKLYISNENKSKNGTQKKYHLVDLQDSSSMILQLKVEGNDEHSIALTFGVDSLLNYQGPMEGDLDPLNGMYWAWQSGYINAKMEGWQKVKGELSPFTWHLGGFLNGNRCEVRKKFPIHQEIERYVLHIPLDGIFIPDHHFPNRIMSPCQSAVEMSKALFENCKLEAQ